MYRASLILAALVVALLLARYSVPGNLGEGTLKIVFLDVGQGDSVLFIMPDGQTLLIDGGPNTDADWLLQDYISKYLCRVNMVLLTHPDADHVSGLVRVAEHCHIDMIFQNITTHNSFVYGNWLTKSKKFESMEMYDNARFSVSGVNFYIVWPPENFLNKNTNDLSLSVFVDYGNFEALFLGDLGNTFHSQVHKRLKSLDHLIDRPFELLKSTHHGAANGLDKNLTSWLDPEVFVISVGKSNTYGHPRQEVLDFVSELGSNIFRTDRDGTIEILVNR